MWLHYYIIEYSSRSACKYSTSVLSQCVNCVVTGYYWVNIFTEKMLNLKYNYHEVIYHLVKTEGFSGRNVETASIFLFEKCKKRR